MTREETKPSLGFDENFLFTTGTKPPIYTEAKNNPVKKKVRINITALGT